MRWAALCLGAALLTAAAPPAGHTGHTGHKGRVLVMQLDGAIQPAAQRYLERGLQLAAQEDASLVVVELDTPGGLLVSLREMTTAIVTSKVPVAVLVAPAGARAASAGFFLLVAADVAAMAPGTNAGAAHPVALGQQQQADETMVDKAVQDAAALIRSLAAQRHRSVEWAERAVTKSRSYAAEEAHRLGLVEVVARDLDELLVRLDGQPIRRFDGRSERLEIDRAEIVRVELTFAERLLMVIADPQIAYLLLMVGVLGLLVELMTPGATVPGVVGGVSLLLALYALSVLPVNWAGALLISLGVGLLIAEAFVVSYGVLALAGVASFVLGSLVLVDVPASLGGVGLELVLPSAAVLAAVSLWLLVRSLRLRRAPQRTGLEGMVGEVGELIAPIQEGSADGKVFVHGEYWNATSERPLPLGARVRIEAIEGNRLRVVPAEHSAR